MNKFFQQSVSWQKRTVGGDKCFLKKIDQEKRYLIIKWQLFGIFIFYSDQKSRNKVVVRTKHGKLIRSAKSLKNYLVFNRFSMGEQ